MIFFCVLGNSTEPKYIQEESKFLTLQGGQNEAEGAIVVTSRTGVNSSVSDKNNFGLNQVFCQGF